MHESSDAITFDNHKYKLGRHELIRNAINVMRVEIIGYLKLTKLVLAF